MMATVVLHGAWLLTMAEGAEPIQDAYIKIVDDKISAVGPGRMG